MQSFTCLLCGQTTFDVLAVRHGRCCGTSTKATPASYPPIWAIYDHPRDQPNHFVVRVSWGTWQERRAQLAPTLEVARLAVQMEGGCFCLDRDPTDPPFLTECWI